MTGVDAIVSLSADGARAWVINLKGRLALWDMKGHRGLPPLRFLGWCGRKPEREGGRFVRRAGEPAIAVRPDWTRAVLLEHSPAEDQLVLRYWELVKGDAAAPPK